MTTWIEPPTRLALALLCAWAVNLAPGRAENSAPAAPTSSRYSFLDPVGEFTRDSILRPTAPFELVPGKSPNDWGFVLEPYAWALGMDGTIQLANLPAANINLSNRSILQNLNWGIFARGEVRKGRFGLLADGYYADLSASADLSNRVYDNLKLGVQQSLVSLALAYRLIDDRRGFLDLYAGARYNFLGAQIDGSLNEQRINQIGQNTSADLARRIDARVDSAISTLTGAEAAVVDQVKAQVGDRALDRLLSRDPDLRDLLRDRTLRSRFNSPAIRRAIQEYIQTTASAKIAAAKGAASGELESAAANAKSKLSREVSSAISDSLPTHGAQNRWWVDPIIGLRGQVNLTRWLFLAAQSDVGGFGAGSQIAWNLQATVGFNFTRHVFAELGYRYMYVDYDQDNFLYDVNSFGLFSGIGVRF